MGSLPQLSVIKGPHHKLKRRLLHKIFEENLNEASASNPALIVHGDEGRKTSYETLNANANRMASFLLQKIRKSETSSPNTDGDWIIAVCMTPSDNLITTLLTIWKCGAAYLPIDSTFPQNRMEMILGEAQPTLVIYDQFDKIDIFSSTNHISFRELEKQSQNESSANIETKDTLNGELNDLAIILYTSGSTGIPKGVRLPHSIILNRLQWQFEAFPYSPTEKICVFKTALTFVDSISEIWGPLLNEMAILIIPKDVTKDPERLVDALEKYKIERLVLVPTLLRSLLMYLPLKNQKNLLYNLRIWVCSGETLSVSLAQEFFNYFIEGTHVLCNFYGSTEIMGDVTYFICESQKQLSTYEKVPIGFPIYNTVAYILDGDYRPVKMGQTGELFVSGLNLANGYVNGRDQFRFIENPLATDPRYNRLYRTGDYASILKGGIVQYEGRTDSQIKIRGHRVDLSEIEKHVFSIAGIDKGMVLCYHAGEIDQALLAFVTITEDAKFHLGLQIETVLSHKLADYMIPQVIIVESIPLLVNGKIDRQSLLKSYENTNNNGDSTIVLDYDFSGVSECQMNIVKDLYETIGQVIGRSTRATLSLNSNFYQLGGNSLNSIYTVTQLRNKGYFIGITDFITANTLQDILDKISVGVAVQEEQQHLGNQLEMKSIPLTMQHKSEVIELMTTSFYEKADLEQWLKPLIRYTDYADLFEATFVHLVENDLCFIVQDANGRMVGVSLNMDANNEPEVEIHNKLEIVFEFLEYIEGPIRNTQLPKGLNQIFHTNMMGTNSTLSPQENIAVMQFMEDEVLKLAKLKGFAGIFTTNTSPLTQQLGTHVYGYETLLDYQVNQYMYLDGTKPFGKAPDTQRAIAQWKKI